MKSEVESGHDSDARITFIIRRRVLHERHTDLENWSKGIAEACQRFEGYLGIRIIYPENDGQEFVTILSFDNYPNFCAWADSTERKIWLDKVQDLTEGEVKSELFRGFDYWLGSENQSSRSWPPDFRMIVIAFVAIWPLVYLVVPLLAPLMPQNALLSSVISTVIITLLMGYVTLPVMTRICRRWLQQAA